VILSGARKGDLELERSERKADEGASERIEEKEIAEGRYQKISKARNQPAKTESQDKQLKSQQLIPEKLLPKSTRTRSTNRTTDQYTR
jgi:hypothetical protein